MEPVFRTLEIIAHGLVRAQGLDLRIDDEDNLPRTGGVVLAINHTSYVDFLPAAIGVYRAGRRVRYMIKAETMKYGIMRFLIKHTKTVPVDRLAGADAYRQAVQTLRDGEVVAVYPEATISRSFELKAFKTGAVRMAHDANVPIVPCIVWGAHRQWTKGHERAMGRTGLPVHVRFGPALTVDGDVQTGTDRLRTAMQDLLSTVQAGYGPHPAREFWVPASMGGGAPTLAEADRLDTEEQARRAAARAGRETSGDDAA
ncbi:lysophospholipid acyltransferase family protein [Williamsia sterculiae]|uniref:1-acyl-sn-glycerol-3-phosphate acyltransferases n=1 Tax=Williamsia sterculiae TaxID=1344003 RepID=A0A1N7H8V6_9NOCA|nr:lysophospholipid acyltransferase family protein [Williamsia sterculiae]SIS21221.1 1-acyl-sn-glycerol-3-phosphate acyltransferases [Williamsia sterculiae]